jgi:hypothetical protein
MRKYNLEEKALKMKRKKRSLPADCRAAEAFILGIGIFN